jgi:hypothetical protein
MLKRLWLWLLAALMATCSLGLAQQPTPTCEERLATAEKLILILRDERDRAQQQMGQAWSLAERYERAQKLQSKAGEVPKTEGEPAK